MKNPYLNRVAIRDVNQFYGRRKEIARIFSRIGSSRPQSVSIVGERRIGKSSLLNYIYASDIRSQQLDISANYIFVFMDLQEKRYSNIESFFADLLYKVSEATSELATPSQTDFDSVRKVFADLHRRRQKLIILFDEFDVITANKAFSLDFFSFLRSAANNYDVAYITSSARELQVLCHTDQIADSPFFNIFTNIYLRPFSLEEATLLIREPSTNSGINLEPFIKDIISLSGYFPFFLQIACSNYFDHILENSNFIDAKRVEEGFLDEAGVHFRYIWEHMGEAEREVINFFIAGQSRPKAREHVFEELRRAGYFIEDGNSARLFSKLFATAIARVSSPAPIANVNKFLATPPSGSSIREYFESDEIIPPTDPAITHADMKKLRNAVNKNPIRDGLEKIKQQGKINHFEILKVLGKGGMGEVLLARDQHLKRLVAIKLLKSRYASDEPIRRRFLREAQTASMLSHPNIATIYEIGEIDDIPYIVMEYVHGKTLSEYLHKTPFSFKEIASIGSQSALALAEAHSFGIIHRDVKSSNILVNERGKVKMLDFGLAKPGIFNNLKETDLNSSDPRLFNPTTNITEPGILMGTVTYMSPEQASGKEQIDNRSDIFSLGIVLYEITTGTLPFDGSTYFQIIEAITKADPKPITNLRQDIPETLVSIIMKALEKDPKDRYQTAQLMADELNFIK
ncbi:MAG: protein kinase [Acidobacteria bacterium]|nr:protein kinase [Acidobacteriota bacterium]